MSFFNNNKDTRCPGPINGNPNQGLNDKVCILTDRVFDSGLSQVPIQDVNITLTNFNPQNPTYPLTFVGCASQGTDLQITNLVVDRFEDRPNFARVTATVEVPIVVSYVDANGVDGTATGTYTANLDVIMSLPRPSIVPFEITKYYNCGPAETSALPASFVVYLTKFFWNLAARSFAFVSHSVGSA